MCCQPLISSVDESISRNVNSWTMSGGEPSSIKRNLTCAARQPALSRLSGQRTYYIFKNRCAIFHQHKTLYTNVGTTVQCWQFKILSLSPSFPSLRYPWPTNLLSLYTPRVATRVPRPINGALCARSKKSTQTKPLLIAEIGIHMKKVLCKREIFALRYLIPKSDSYVVVHMLWTYWQNPSQCRKFPCC